MVRATNAVATQKRKRRLLKRAKGFFGDRKNHRRQTKNAVMKALADSTRHRKTSKAQFRSLWITRVGIAAKVEGISYSKLMQGLKKAGCLLNRKMLSEMAIHDPAAFKAVAHIAKSMHGY